MPEDSLIRQLLIAPADLHAEVRKQMTVVRKLLGPTTTNYAPQLLALCRDRPGAELSAILFVLATNFNAHAEKVAALRRVGREVYAKRTVPVAVVFSSEVWCSTQRSDEPRRYAQPSDDPERQEAIIVVGTLIDGSHTCQALLPVTRGPGAVMVPGEFGEIQSEGVKFPLMGHFFRGFMEEPARKLGLPGWRERS